MYDKRRVKLPDNITLDWILSKVSEYDIYAHYLGQFKVGMIYNSPFRKDKNPSFGIYYSKRTNQLLFKDHGTGESGNVIKLEHNQFVSTNRNAAVELRITLEAFGTEHKMRIMDALEEKGYQPKLVRTNI